MSIRSSPHENVMTDDTVLIHVLKARIDEHTVSCDRFRGIAQWVATGVIAATLSMLIFMASQIMAQRDAIKSIENVTLRIEADSTKKIQVLTEAQIARASVMRDDVSRVEGSVKIMSEKIDRIADMLHEHELNQSQQFRARGNK